MEDEIYRNYLKYERNSYTYDFQQFQRSRYFDDSIFNCKVAVIEADKKSNLLENILKFNSKAIPRAKADQEKKILLKV